MFCYFPSNYMWSSAFTLALMAGGQSNQMDRWLAPLAMPGRNPTLANSALASAELYSPAKGKWAFTGSMNVARAGQTATLLPDGLVLAAGGGSTPGRAELYNPAAGTWALTGSLHTNRGGQTATLLPDGQVMVAGGYDATTFSPLSSAELYNPATGTWARTGIMTTPRENQTATLLNNGEVLVAGGQNGTGSTVTSAELYNPATGRWALTGSMSTAREGQGATLLPDGDVLVTAGLGGISGLFSELYHPATGRWSAASGGLNACTSVSECRTNSRATLLGDGQVLVAGGLTGLNIFIGQLRGQDDNLEHGLVQGGQAAGIRVSAL